MLESIERFVADLEAAGEQLFQNTRRGAL